MNQQTISNLPLITSTTDLTIIPGTSRGVIISQTGPGGPTGPALKIINSDPGLTGPAIVQYHNSITPTGNDSASNYITNANVILPGGGLQERTYSNIRTVLTSVTGPTGASASIAFDLANGSPTGVTGGMSTIMTISGRDPTPYPAFISSSLSQPQGVQIVTTDNPSSLNRRDIAGLRVQNISNNGNATVIQTVKQRTVTSSFSQNGDNIGAWSAWGTTNGGTYREYSRIRTQIANSVSGGSIGPDGAVVIAVAENDNTGSIPLKDMFRCDGGYALTLPTGPTGPYNLSYATMVFNPTGATGPQDITGIKAIGNASFNYGVTGQSLISNGPNSSFTWGNPTLQQVLNAGNNAGATGIDMNQQTISNVPTITSTTNIDLTPVTSIRTDSNITTLSVAGGSKIDFAGGNPDERFNIDKNDITLHWNTGTGDQADIVLENDIGFLNSAINFNYQTTSGNIGTNIQNIPTIHRIVQSDTINNKGATYSPQKVELTEGLTRIAKLENTVNSGENRMDLFLNSGGGISAQSGIVNTAGTQMLYLTHTDNSISKALSLRQDTAGTGKLQYDNTIDSSAFEISSNNTDLTLTANGGAGNCKVIASTLQFNNVNIIPRRTYQSTLAFNVSGSPTGNILNFGSIADMVASTIWKVDVAFYTGILNTSNILTYVVQDTTPQYVEQNSVFGYSQGGFQNAIEYTSSGTPMSVYCSFTDTFEVGGLASGACSFILTGGTSNGSFWTGTCNVSIVLTRLV